MQLAPPRAASTVRPARLPWWLVPLLLYALVLLFASHHHEPWRDEADSWLVVAHEDLPSLLRLTSYMGTPALWYVLLMPLERLGLGFEAQSAVSVAAGIATAWLVLAHAPWPRPTRVLVVASYFLLFEYFVVARSYGLTVLLLFAAAALFRSRFRFPWIYGAVLALLANTNVHGLIIAVAFLCVAAADLRLVRDRGRARWVIAVLGAAGAAAAIAQLAPRGGGQFPASQIYPRWPMLLTILRDSFVPGGRLPWPWAQHVATMLNAGALAFVVLYLVPRWRALVVFCASSVVLLAVFISVYAGGLRHAGLLFVLSAAAIWIGADGGELPAATTRSVGSAVVHLALAASAALGVRTLEAERTGLFSGASTMARYIAENVPADRPIAAFTDWHAESVLVHLPGRRFWYAGAGDWGTHMTWDARYRASTTMTHGQAVARIMVHFAQEPAYFMLLNRRMVGAEEVGFELVHTVDENIWEHADERYYLYRRR